MPTIEQIIAGLENHETRLNNLEAGIPYHSKDKPSEPTQVIHKIEFTEKQCGMIDELIAEVLHYRQEYPKLLLEIEKLKTIASKRRTNRYKEYNL